MAKIPQKKQKKSKRKSKSEEFRAEVPKTLKINVIAEKKENGKCLTYF